jgi:hypothetical protein
MLANKAMHGYATCCCDTEWFYQLDLAPAYARVCWEMLSAAGNDVPPQVVHEACELDYHDLLERRLLDKAMWDSVKNVFPHGDKVQQKICKALTGSYWPCADEFLKRPQPKGEHEDLQVVEEFLLNWMRTATGRAWLSIPSSEASSEDILTVESVGRLFETLVTPFGEENPFTCIPGALIERIGRPPTGWDFISTAANDVMTKYNSDGDSRPPPMKRPRTRPYAGGGEWGSWDAASAGWYGGSSYHGGWDSASCKGKGGGKGGDGWKSTETASMPNQMPNYSVNMASVSVPEQPPQPGGHPRCTSAEDCVGSPTDRLVQHMLHGKPADIYCEMCWVSFSSRNSALEGKYLS